MNNDVTESLFEYDRKLRGNEKIICGTDEAGRGPLAGDVYAAAVIFDDDVEIEGLNDSKKLSEKKREKLFDEICEKAKSYCIATASVKEIDEMNILNASLLAMKRAVAGLEIAPDTVLVDGNRIPPIENAQVITIVKGDAISASISAASILAKVARDRYMKQLAIQYPEYEFERHKGYPTKLHYEKLDKYGVSPVHRESFLKKWRAGNGQT